MLEGLLTLGALIVVSQVIAFAFICVLDRWR